MINKNTKLAFLAIFILFVIYNFLTLDRYPLPWFDEVTKAKMSVSYLTTGKLIKETDLGMYEGKEDLSYGPVYFILVANFIKWFGVNPLSVRILSFLSGLLAIFLFYKFCKSIQLSEKKSLIITSLFTLDTFYLYSLRNGRMDILCVSLALMSFLLILKKNSSIQYYKYVLSGLLACLALLTSPRIAILLLPIFIVILIKYYKLRDFKIITGLIVWCFTILSGYSFWIFYKFGGIIEFYNFYNTPDLVRGSSFIATFLGGNLKLPFFLIPIFIFSLVCIALFILNKSRGINQTLIFYFSVFSLVLFYLLTHDTGVYSVYIIICYYLIIACAYKIFHQGIIRRIFGYGIVIIFMINLALFSLKNFQVVLTWDQRNSSVADQFVKTYIPEDSKVMADLIYFYSVYNNNCEYKMINPYQSNISLERNFNRYKFDYFILSNNTVKRGEDLSFFNKHFNLEKIGELDLKAEEIPFKFLVEYGQWDRYATHRAYDYSGVIYKNLVNNDDIK
ncbi:ArnT family glycosyltransferase [Bacteroidota bacterium]